MSPSLVSLSFSLAFPSVLSFLGFDGFKRDTDPLFILLKLEGVDSRSQIEDRKTISNRNYCNFNFPPFLQLTNYFSALTGRKAIKGTRENFLSFFFAMPRENRFMFAEKKKLQPYRKSH